MSMSYIADLPAIEQRTSDHSISIPRPREALEVGTPNACTTCHKGKSAEWALVALTRWGQTEALKARPWVVAIARAREQAPGSTEQLMRIIEDPSSGLFVRLSALELLQRQPEEPAVIPGLIPLTRSANDHERSLAYRALYWHDARNAADWVRKASADPSPRVRVDANLSKGQPLTSIDSAILDAWVADTVHYSTPSPLRDLLRVISARERRAQMFKKPETKRRELRRAAELIDLALPYVLRSSVRADLEARRVRIQEQMATVP